MPSWPEPPQLRQCALAVAVLHDVDKVVERCVGIAVDGELTAVSGERVAVRARSLCLHGDTPGAVELGRRVRDALRVSGVDVKPFA